MQVRRLAVRELRVPPPVSTTPLASDLPLLRHDADPFGVNNHPTWMSLLKPPKTPIFREPGLSLAAIPSAVHPTNGNADGAPIALHRCRCW